jgi:hypothetical protein
MMQPANWWPLLGGLILVAVLAYFGFQAVDAAGVQPQTGSAIVLGKEHKPPGKSYKTDIVGGQTRVIPQYTPDLYLLKLRIGNQETSAAVDRDLFESIAEGDRVSVTYQRRRLTGGLQVIRVKPEGK